MNLFKRLIARIKATLASQDGFTLIELMVVIVILSILATLAFTQLKGIFDKPNISAAMTQIKSLESALEMYKIDNGNYPSTEQGLAALVEKPSSDSVPQKYNDNGYLSSKKIPQDPWSHPYVYTCDGGNNYSIISLGADGKEGGSGVNADIKSGEF